MNTVQITWNTEKKTGSVIRKLNGGNLAPNIHGERSGRNIRESFRQLNLAYTRLHDAPLDNPGCRLVDISHIFPLFHLDENDPRNYDFSYTDDYIRNCIEDAGTPVFYRLGESIDHSVRKYKINPPPDIPKWINICSNIIRHYTEGLWDGFHYPIVYWEIWNEATGKDNMKLYPDGKNNMWLGTMEEFNAFYVQTATELKKRFPHLKIGGPASVDYFEGITDVFIRYCAEHHAPLDFYSYHCYGDGDPYGWIQQTPFKVRKLLDENGYADTEIHLNEWHYFPGGNWTRLSSDPIYKDLMFNQELRGLDSAAYLTTVMTLWQDTPITYGAYYTCTSTAWGCYKKDSSLPTPSYYGLKAFGEIVRYPIRLEAESSRKDVTVLAGENETGAKAMLISAFKTGNLEYELKADIPLNPSNCRIHLLDNEHRMALVEDAVFSGNTVKFKSASNSACVLVNIE